VRTILRPDELERIERELGDGVSARQVVTLFQERGVRFSEATFRKYVQSGLLPRSRRVGHKGKHRGSRGLYPTAVVRRINAIKAMMAEGMTLEEIRGSFLSLRGDLDDLEETVERIVAELTRALSGAVAPAAERTRLRTELRQKREEARRLTRSLERLGSRIAAARAAASGQGREGA
jgi:DNA-binding transcriptional MerR regulator